MKAITIQQPYATFLIAGVKQFETRPWTTHHRGPILIHASRTHAPNTQALWEAMRKHFTILQSLPEHCAQLPHQAIVGIATVTNAYPAKDFFDDYGQLLLHEPEIQMGFWLPQNHAIQIDDPIPFRQPVKHPGALGIWDYFGPLEELLQDSYTLHLHRAARAM